MRGIDRSFLQSAECASLALLVTPGWCLALSTTQGGRQLPTDDREARVLPPALKHDAGKEDSPPAWTSTKVRHTFTTPLRLWLRAAEDYAAIHVVDYMQWVTRQLHVLALFLLLSLLLTTALISTYPFYPQSLVRLVFFFVLLGTIGGLVYVMTSMNRNEVLSRLTDTEPGRITWSSSFVMNLIAFGVLPLLALLSSELPGVRMALFSWVEPVVKAVAHQ